MAVPNALPTVSRRRVLVGTAALVLFGGALPGCSSPPTRDPALDVLIGQLGRARSDSALAATAAITAQPKVASALTTVASIRDAHAQALSDEIQRIGGATTTSATSATSAAAATSSAVPAPAPTAQDVVGALQQSADGATQAAVDLSGYRAGLLASIAAACTTASTVALAA
ncbi:hypothetical protein ABIA30_000400 [Mycobacterium sp. MAA66]|uniref:hypothetical protein n=1 Tax=Mycobacterium sp. MAA66 TaxID=3156297 RepID=UPI003516B456